jgi:hypothetical protein
MTVDIYDKSPIGKYSELFVFYRRGHPVHIHSDRKVFEGWMQTSAWLYPPAECEIVRFIPEDAAQSLTGCLHQRRFGRDHEKPCNDPTVLTCAFSECQEANECRCRPSPTAPDKQPLTSDGETKV